MLGSHPSPLLIASGLTLLPAHATAGVERASVYEPPSPPSPRTADISAPPPSNPRGRAFAVTASGRLDPYGRRPEGVARLTLDQIARYSLENPAVQAAEEEVNAMRAQLRKAKFAWVPVIETQMTLSPGVRIRCDDLTLNDAAGEGFDFQYCRTRDDNDFDVNTIDGYFSQLSEAGVRFEFRADMVIPLTTFGKIRNARKAAEVGVALRELQKNQAQQETLLRVYRAHTTLLLARDSISILREAKDIVASARARVEKDLGGGDDAWDAEPEDNDALRDPDDGVKVQLAELELEQLMWQALKIEAVSLSALWALAGDAAPPGFDIAAPSLQPMEVVDGVKTLAEYTQMAIAQRPEARMAAAAVKAREYQEKLARANFLPDLGIAVSTGIGRANAVDTQMSQLYYQDNFNWTRFVAALAMRWRWDFHLKMFDLEAARATQRAAMRQQEAAALLLGLDVQKAYGDLIEAERLAESYSKAVELTWRLVVSGETKDTVGGGDASELMRNLKSWYQRRFDYARAVHGYNDALARLSRAVGTPLGRDPAAAGAASASRSGPARAQ